MCRGSSGWMLSEPAVHPRVHQLACQGRPLVLGGMQLLGGIQLLAESEQLKVSVVLMALAAEILVVRAHKPGACNDAHLIGSCDCANERTSGS